MSGLIRRNPLVAFFVIAFDPLVAFSVIAVGVTWLLQVPAVLLAEANDQTLSNEHNLQHLFDLVRGRLTSNQAFAYLLFLLGAGPLGLTRYCRGALPYSFPNGMETNIWQREPARPWPSQPRSRQLSEIILEIILVRRFVRLSVATWPQRKVIAALSERDLPPRAPS